MKCPHCGRTWTAADLDIPGIPASMVLVDHVGKFCPGSPLPERERPVAVPRRR